MYVIPLVLEERDVNVIHEDYLKKLASCSTDIVKKKVKEYLNSTEAQPLIKEKVYECYKQVLSSDEFLMDEVLKEEIKPVEQLRFSDISSSLPEQKLRQYKGVLEKILGSEFAVPYIEPITSDTINSLLDEMTEYGQRDSRVKQLVTRIRNNKHLFKDPRFTRARGTIVKRVMLNVQKFEIILRGINFLLKQNEQGRSPESWRLL